MHGAKRTYLLLVFFLFAGVMAYPQAPVNTVTDSTQKVLIAAVHIQGNARTKNYIITRDITFQKGDTLALNELEQQLDRSQKNIFNSALFNYVKVEAVKLREGEREVFITVKERWYIIPAPVFELYDRNYKEWWNTYNHDLRRVTYGIRFSHRNFSGRKDKLDIFLVSGFSKQVLLRYTQPYADRNLRHGFSIAAGYSERIGESYQILGNTYMPRDTCRDYNGDGVADCGGDTSLNYRVFDSRERFAGLGYTYRKGLYANHVANLSILNKTVADTITQLNKNFFGRGFNHETYIQLSYAYNYSKLDFNPYPLVGSFSSLGFQARLARHTTSQFLLYGYYGKFFRIAGRFYFGTTAAAAVRISKGHSFYNLRASNLQIANIRGLEQYAILSTAEANLKNTIRYRVYDRIIKLPFRVKNHEYIPLKLYLKAFGDLAYAHITPPNVRSLNNTLLRTAGFGLDIVTVYDISLRIDFSINQLGQASFYFK